MDVKGKLEHPYRLYRRILAKEAQLKSIQESATSISSPTADTDHVMGGLSSDKISDIIFRITEAEKEIQRMKIDLVEEKMKLAEALNKMENEDYILVLTKRFLGFESIESIAKEKAINPQTVRKKLRLAEAAFEKLEEIHEDSQRFTKVH